MAAKKKKILGAAVGDCVHVAGVVNFLRLAHDEGFATEFLGPAVSPHQLVNAVLEYDPDIIGLSYRLTPAAGEKVLSEIMDRLADAGLGHKRLAFGGTEPVCDAAENLGGFEQLFPSAASAEDVIAYLRGGTTGTAARPYPDNLADRIAGKHPYPVIRHHFGLPDYEATVAGVAAIAASGTVDVISLGVDQNTQEHFFRPDKMDPTQHGAGGVPVRSAAEFRRLYDAAQTGNFPLVRSYSGTRDILQMAAVLRTEINNAWCAVPLTWYSVLDGRSTRPVRAAVQEAQTVMAWHARHDVPVEMNESHHWSLRDAPDTVAAAMAFLAAYNARAAGVRDYIQQLMFNNPPGTSPIMDLAKMLAKLDLVESLQGPDFNVWRQTRGGLSSYPADFAAAKGHLAATTMLQMALRPHILHVVGFTEAHHAARPEEVVESCRISRRVIENCLQGLPDMTLDPRVQARRRELVAETKVLLAAVAELAPPGTKDPWADPVTITRAISMGLMDAPHLRNNPAALGTIVTRSVDGAYVAVDPATGAPLTEEERLGRLRRDVSA